MRKNFSLSGVGKIKVLVTGGAGFIGSHTVVQLIKMGHEVLIVDNHVNSSQIALERINELCECVVPSANVDICDQVALDATFNDFKPEAVIHFAGLKAVGESNDKPLWYYENNIQGTLVLLKSMGKHKCHTIVFSSSATVYGDPHYLPLDEAHSCAPTNPYGKTKYFVEEILKDWCSANEKSIAVALRYFNPVGAHFSGRIGEDPVGIPNNLMPYISQVASGKREHLNVFGNDYDTPDGTGVRDYLHVEDLAAAHVAAIENLSKITGYEVINLGTGNGYSVLEVVKAFERASNAEIKCQIMPRREGDIAACWANADKAKSLLDWQAKYEIDEMCSSAWNWQSKNPNGYETLSSFLKKSGYSSKKPLDKVV